jgi:hypothetical protein
MNSDGKNQNMLFESGIFIDWFGPSPGQYIKAFGKLKTTWGNIKLNQ